ncbi:MAG: cytochrome oxidase small assembly protein [Sulfuritalea sp.]|jgi:hypothetical protein|nr:cytochrome oxidase small assembly protein [Sulfuritalea sp.]
MRNEAPSHAPGNRRIALGLALFAAAVFVSFIVRQWMANA